MDVLIIEDELNAFDILKKRIDQLLPHANIIGPIKSIVESIHWFIGHNAPDLVFLDIELSDGQSFEIFKHITVHCPIIFTTAYDQYAIKAFRLNSVDYLLKPISEEDLQQALEKYQHMRTAFNTFPIHHYHDLIQARSYSIRKRFLVHTGEKYFFINTRDISYIYAEEGVTFLRTISHSRHLINETLDQLMQELDKEQFFRINRHQIVHLEAIKTIHEYFNRRFKLEVSASPDEHEFIVSRLKRAAFKKWLEG